MNDLKIYILTEEIALNRVKERDMIHVANPNWLGHKDLMMVMMMMMYTYFSRSKNERWNQT